jgi:hypothetical protein
LRNIEAAHRGKKFKGGFVWAHVPIFFVCSWARSAQLLGLDFDFGFLFFPPLFRHRVAEAGQGILTNMFEHVDAQRIVRVYEEA